MELHSYALKDIVSSSVVPAVLISACGLLCLAFYNRLAAIVTRLRSLQRERLSEHREVFEKEVNEEKHKLSEELLLFLEEQTSELLKRACFLKNCLFCLISAILSLLLTSLLIGVSMIFPALEWAVALFFLWGLGLMLTGISFALFEVKISLNPIRAESAFVRKKVM